MSSIDNLRTESEKREYYLKILSENFVYIPFRYVLPLMESNIMEAVVNIIENVNREEEKLANKWKEEAELLRLYEKYSKDTSNNKRKYEEDEEVENHNDDDNKKKRNIESISTSFVTWTQMEDTSSSLSIDPGQS